MIRVPVSVRLTLVLLCGESFVESSEQDALVMVSPAPSLRKSVRYGLADRNWNETIWLQK